MAKLAFVTGGSGFVGRHLLAELVERGYRVRALARSDTAAEVVEAFGASAHRGDLNDEGALTEAMRGVDLVFHAAAYVKEWGPRKAYIDANIGGTRRVIAAAKRAGVRRLVHIGTEAVLAGGEPIIDVDESTPLPTRFVGLYPMTKAAAERLVLAANGPELETVVVRPRFIWGKGDTSLLPQFVDAVRNGRFRWVDGGHYLTSTCHVVNVIEGTLLAADLGAPGEVYFLTDGDPIEFRLFLTALLSTARLRPPTSSVPFWLAKPAAHLLTRIWRGLALSSPPPLTATALHLMCAPVVVNDEKARRELGYRASVSIEDGLREMHRPRRRRRR